MSVAFDTDRRPLALMLAHCLPDAVGNADRARAWQLLRLAARTHRVFLACVLDGPAHWVHWRNARQYAQRIVLEYPRRGGGWIAGLWALSHQPASQRWLIGRALGPVLGPWRADFQFDAVLCTHPALWPLARAIAAPQHLCDLHAPMSLLHRRLAEAAPRSRRLWHRRQAALHRQLEERIAAACDTVTVAHGEAERVVAGAKGRVVMLPEAIDLRYFQGHAGKPTGRPEAVTPAPPRLIFHADWRHSGEGRGLDWFAREVWPQVAHAVPAARMANTRHAPPTDPLQHLRHTSVVVTPDLVPDLARWPILQAMAMRQTVIAAGQAVEGLGLQDGRHLLLSRKPADWADLCVQTLRSAQVRLHLARGARQFVESHCPIEHTGQELIQTPRGGRGTKAQLALAA